MKRLATGLTALLLCLALLPCAMAEAVLTPYLALWDDVLTVQMNLGAQVDVHMPFDDTRCEQLNALLSHVTLQLGLMRLEAEEWSRAALCVDGTEAVSLIQRQQGDQTVLRLSCLPEETFATSQAGDASSALGLLLGEESGDAGLFGLDGTEHAWLDDGYAMLLALEEPLSAWCKESSVKTTVKSMGTARLKRVYTVAKDQAEEFASALIAACPMGKLGTLLSQLTFTGQQKLTVLLTSAGEPLRVDYTGRCGLDAEHQREVTLVWRMRRDNSNLDELSLKTPAVKGTDRNTLTLSRKLAAKKTGTMSYESKFTYEWVASKKKTTLTGECSLTSVNGKKESELTGSVKLKRQLPDADTTETVKLTPKLVLTGDPSISGTVLVQEYSGSNVVEQATVSVEIVPGSTLEWALRENVTALDQMDPENLAALRQRTVNALGGAVIPHLVLLPEEDTLYLSADLPPETWQAVVNAAQQALREEENP